MIERYRTMKNSLFKRVAAAASAVPLALTQCLNFSSFAEVKPAVPSSSVSIKSADNDKAITIEKLLWIDPEQVVPESGVESTWNAKASSILDTFVSDGNTSFDFNAAKAVEYVAKMGGQYKDVANALASSVSNGKVTIDKKNNDIIVTADVNDVAKALNKNVQNSLGELAKKLADKYNAPSLETIDFESVKIDGSVKVTIKTSKLDAGKKIC